MTITVIQLFTALLVLHICSVSPFTFLCEHNLLCLNLSARLIGGLRLLCRLSSSSRQRSGPVADAVIISDDSISAWRDPAVVSALVSFLPRSVRFGQHQVMMMTCHSSFFMMIVFFFLKQKIFVCVSLFFMCVASLDIQSIPPDSLFSFCLYVF